MLVPEMDILVKILSLVFSGYKLTLYVWCQERQMHFRSKVLFIL